MPDLSFEVDGAAAVPFCESPLLAFRLRVANRSGEPIHSIMLRCQIMIETTRRSYTAEERPKLADLFGYPEQWKQTLHGMLWTISTVLVPAFSDTTVTDLPVPCTFDFNVAATKYFGGLEGGEVPLCLLFSGTVFYQTSASGLQVAQIPWDRQAEYRLPVRLWRELMDMYYPNTAWLCLERDVFERLRQFRTQHALATWDQALDMLLPKNP